MNTMKFKTNITCSGCLAKATPHLDQAAGPDNWEINLQEPQKTLTVITDDAISETEIIDAVRQAGYVAEKVA